MSKQTDQHSGIACAGNWIVDVVHDIDRFPQPNHLVEINSQTVGIGGGAANVATDLVRFGVDYPVLPIGRLGGDAHGDVVIAHCDLHGLSTEHLRRDNAVATAHTHVMNVPGQSRTFFYHPGANDRFDQSDLSIDMLVDNKLRILYLGYLLLLGELDRVRPDARTDASRVLEQARAAGLLTCVDLVSADRDDFEAVVAPSLAHIDCLFVNEVELARASGRSLVDEDDEAQLADAAAELLSRGVQRAVIVHTPRVAMWCDISGEITISHPVPRADGDIVSAVGAGDAFCAGMLHALHERWPVARALALAHAAASASLSGQTATDAVPRLSELVNES